MKFQDVQVGKRFCFRGFEWRKVSRPRELAYLGCAERADVRQPALIGFNASTRVSGVKP